MGAADVVPGVSGGTMALITGIYDRLVAAIAAITPARLSSLWQGRWRAFWRQIDGTFLLVLLAGIGSAFVFLAGGIRWLLNHQPLLTWSFFFGLILASAVLIVQRADIRDWRQYWWLLPGFLLGWWISDLTQGQVDASWLMVFFSGMLAIMAMILPGISGSFILLLLGMYGVLLAAVDERQWLVLATFVAGALIGLLGFSHFLKWLLSRYHGQTLLFLCGLMLGSLRKIWPWHDISHLGGISAKVWPWQLPASEAMFSVLVVAAAMLLVFVTHWLGQKLSAASVRR